MKNVLVVVAILVGVLILSEVIINKVDVDLPTDDYLFYKNTKGVISRFNVGYYPVEN